MNPKVSIIILNWNGWKDTIECLESLYQITYPHYDVIVVDNGSKDESVEKIKEYAEGKIKVESKFFKYDPSNKPVKIIEYTREEAGGKEKEIIDFPSNRKLIIIKNEKNYGFAEGNNIAVRYALKSLNPDYVLLLNNDTVVDKKFLDELVKIGSEKIGIAYPTVQYYYNPEKIQSPVSFSKKHQNVPQNYLEMGYTDVYGMAFLINRKIFEKIGFFDEKYFLYTEEIDFQYRATKENYKLLFVPSSHVYHKRSKEYFKDYQIYYGTRNLYYFTKKNLGYKKLMRYIVGILCLAVRDMMKFKLNLVISRIRGLIDGILGKMGKR